MLDLAKPEHRQGLSAAAIAERAFEIVDADGYDALSFRALGKVMGCEAMSLYHYYPSKAHLRDALIDMLLAEIKIDTNIGKPWRARLGLAARSWYEALIAHPSLASVFLMHRLNHKNGVVWVVSLASILEDAGLPPDRSAAFFSELTVFVTGSALREIRGLSGGLAAAEPALEISAYATIGDPARNHELFEHGLTMILDRIEAELPTPSLKDVREARRARRLARLQ